MKCYFKLRSTKGEFGFFDFYIIRLAKKLNKCGIHGEASEEYLKNSMEKRRLWAELGEKLVAKYIVERDAEEAAEEGRDKVEDYFITGDSVIRMVLVIGR